MIPNPGGIARALAIDGWMSEGELSWLAAQAAQSQVIVEIGSWKGRSTRALGDNVASGGYVLAVDHWKGQLHDASAGPNAEIAARGSEAIFTEFCHNLADLTAAGRVVPVMAESGEAVRMVERLLDRPVDLVFIDADHQYPGCKADIINYRRFLRPGGILAGHDYNTLERHAGVRQSVDELYPAAHKTHSIWWVRV